jgi:23S rRNA pseudoU1915 N3-methylase RlmH
MRIKVITVGRIKEKFYVNAIKEYIKKDCQLIVN